MPKIISAHPFFVNGERKDYFPNNNHSDRTKEYPQQTDKQTNKSRTTQVARLKIVDRMKICSELIDDFTIGVINNGTGRGLPLDELSFVAVAV